VDDQRFDNLARALAKGASRRQGFRMLAGGAATLLAFARGSGAAQGQQWLTAGDPCYDSSQCRAADAPLTCADNGFDYDGPLNCCTYEQGRCFADEGCCGTALCVNGFCAAAPDFPSNGFRCQNSSQCLSGDRPLYCDYVATVDDYRCCTTDGYWCASNEDCCGWNTCNGNVCGSAPAPAPSYCTSEWCDCYQGPNDDNPCDPGLFCCLSTNTTGVCMTQFNCQGGSGLPGDICARYCLPGPGQCPGCISGYCNAAGVCG
jgi:hypothetical protein